MRVLRSPIALTSILLAVTLACAQDSNTPPPGSANGTNGNGTSGANNGGGRTQFPSDAPRPMFLSGKVVLADGSPLPVPARIERICSGTARPEGVTDQAGNFNLQLGVGTSVIADASEDAGRRGSSSGVGQGVRQRELTDCEIRASLPGYRSDGVSLVDHHAGDDSNLGTIIMHPLVASDGLTTSATSALAPKEAKRAYEKGLEDVVKNKLEDARKEFEKAVEMYPRYAAAWVELGRVEERRERLPQAREAYAQALKADSKFLNTYERLYLLAFKESKWDELAVTTDKVIHLNPFDFPSAFYYNAVANLELKNLDVAESSAREVIRIEKAHPNPKAGYLLGLILALKRNFSESAQYLRAYLITLPNAPDAAEVRKQLSQVEKLALAEH